MATRSFSRAIAAIGKAGNEAQQRYLSDLAQRERASRILRPDEIAGDYDAGRLLTTTLGGGAERPLTMSDLQTFQQNVRMLQAKFKGGITPKVVIERSLEIDRVRANREIPVCLPAQTYGNKVHFVTNASKQSEVKRHHVVVEFLNFDAAVASPSKASDLVKTVASGAVKFDCDCGRHRYWYRYIASIGKYNAGRAETGFPKIRNPKLTGIACKHVLRTMQQLTQPIVRMRLIAMIDAARKSIQPVLVRTSQKEAKALAEQQAKQAGWKRNTIESSEERKSRLASQRRANAIVEREKARVAKLTPAARAADLRRTEQAARLLASQGAISQAQLRRILAGNQGKK